jgi:DNA-binding transcriptional MocR family regulator
MCDIPSDRSSGRDAILRGELLEGEQLPSIRALAKDLRISVITTKRAYDDLEQEGYIVTSPAKARTSPSAIPSCCANHGSASWRTNWRTPS